METINTFDLEVGNIVLTHGCKFLLTERHTWEQHSGGQTFGVVSFRTELLHRPDGCAMPQHWADDWTIQGNELRRWTVINAGVQQQGVHNAPAMSGED
jgi:hypothetical protein